MNFTKAFLLQDFSSFIYALHSAYVPWQTGTALVINNPDKRGHSMRKNIIEDEGYHERKAKGNIIQRDKRK